MWILLYRLEEFYAAPCETFEPYYGVKEDGNVYTPENIISLHERVMDSTEQQGVHFMMADGVSTEFFCFIIFLMRQSIE